VSYKYFGFKIVCIIPDHKKADVIINDKLESMIMKFPPFAIESVADIGLYQTKEDPNPTNVTYGGTNICYGFPSGMPEWNIQIRKSSISTCMQASWKPENLKSWITRLVTSGLNWWQRTSLKLHTHLFDPNTPIP